MQPGQTDREHWELSWHSDRLDPLPEAAGFDHQLRCDTDPKAQTDHCHDGLVARYLRIDAGTNTLFPQPIIEQVLCRAALRNDQRQGLPIQDSRIHTCQHVVSHLTT